MGFFTDFPNLTHFDKKYQSPLFSKVPCNKDITNAFLSFWQIKESAMTSIVWRVLYNENATLLFYVKIKLLLYYFHDT